jgi:hypothetical protein
VSRIIALLCGSTTNALRSIGDVMAQYDPGNASAPWAAVRFCLQVTVNDVQVYCAVL